MLKMMSDEGERMMNLGPFFLHFLFSQIKNQTFHYFIFRFYFFINF